jgi:hypothetical protein
MKHIESSSNQTRQVAATQRYSEVMPKNFLSKLSAFKEDISRWSFPSLINLLRYHKHSWITDEKVYLENYLNV